MWGGAGDRWQYGVCILYGEKLRLKKYTLTIWCMYITWWIAKATNTLSQYGVCTFHGG
jgi:hypothetical protein